MINIGFSPDQLYLKNKSEKGQKSITSVLVCKLTYINWIYRLEGEGRKQFVLWQNQKVLPIALPKNLSPLACLRFQDISSDVHFQSIWESSEELSNMYIQTTKIIFLAF